ncbi:MAG: YbhB/YbcL family Raf kinase inhibitor-like protein [Candidatus Andeanibacterium colombiense]|uniref:YbhB/YbcL family Raf kinase inhibitor-like protein n=1 Tax=Candidatus Andeanibacterium colombiense TaxID=3121345 RepID=A0AAJ5X9I9_9SPHN|nr:MAG: YbhB/YbcL family Raf kinase inhibitor-like protein [Sphingomonadaceae bacterium]
MGLAALLSACGPSASERQPAPETGVMRLTSTAFAPGATIPAEFTCAGAGISPPLAWTDPPAGTKSFALVVEDPDAPGGVFRHWGVYDIPADRHALAAGAASSTEAGTRTVNDFGKSGYGGPCPPPGDPHHYAFRILALDVAHLPGAPAHASGLIDAIDGHVLASADVVGLYGR